MSDIKIRSHIIEEMQNYTCIYDKLDPEHSRCDRKQKFMRQQGFLLVSLVSSLFLNTCLSCDTSRKTTRSGSNNITNIFINYTMVSTIHRKNLIHNNLGQEVRKEWMPLLDHFCKIVNSEKSGSAGETVKARTNKWWFYDSMSFIRPYFTKQE